jgi:ATP-dependent protease HslVU (ClpYQ) peptidase subunit
MAADSGETWGGEIRSGAVKVFNIGEYLVGFCGGCSVAPSYLDWLSVVQHTQKCPELFFREQESLRTDLSVNVNIVLVNRHSQVWFLTTGGYAMLQPHQYVSMGAGADYAMGAMYQGGTAVQGVQAAIEFDSLCMGPTIYTSFGHELFDITEGLTPPDSSGKRHTVFG